MNKPICKKIIFLIIEMVLLIYIINGISILTHYNTTNKLFEFSYNYTLNNETFLFSQNNIINNGTSAFLKNYSSKIKTYEFILEHQLDLQINKQIKLDYENINFAVIKRELCPFCGLFSNYISYLGCIRESLIQGFIPILDFESYKNIINGFANESLKENPWEYYFNQPFGYTYSNVRRNAKNLKYIECLTNIIRPNDTIFLNKESMKYWHIMANQYIPIKNEIINEANNIIKRIFNGSRNILGVLLRGTDYIARRPRYHPIPPKTEYVIRDVKLLDIKNKYDWVFIATEDDNIRQEFIKGVGDKVKFILNTSKITYNYATKDLLAYNIDFKRNIEFNKIYLLNIIILSKCLDLLAANTSGTIGAFILTEGFRNYKVYKLGLYK